VFAFEFGAGAFDNDGDIRGKVIVDELADEAIFRQGIFESVGIDKAVEMAGRVETFINPDLPAKRGNFRLDTRAGVHEGVELKSFGKVTYLNNNFIASKSAEFRDEIVEKCEHDLMPKETIPAKCGGPKKDPVAVIG
jgi:hypothetical protein